MGLRYRIERAQNGDVIDPSPLNANQNELSGEFNGYLDQDNVPEGTITSDSVVVGAFTQDFGDDDPGPIALDMTSTDWQTILSVTFTAPGDVPIVFDWSGGHKWDESSGGASYDGTSADCIEYAIDVGGMVIAESGPLSDDHQWEGVDLAGEVNVQGGPHTVFVRARVANRYLTIGTNPPTAMPLFSLLGGCINAVEIQEQELIGTMVVR